MPIDLYESDATKFRVVGNSLRPPFVAISGLGETAAFDLMKCRESGRRFISVEEVQAACPGVPAAPIDMKDYGMMNGAAVFKAALKMMGEEV